MRRIAGGGLVHWATVGMSHAVAMSASYAWASISSSRRRPARTGMSRCSRSLDDHARHVAHAAVHVPVETQGSGLVEPSLRDGGRPACPAMISRSG